MNRQRLCKLCGKNPATVPDRERVPVKPDRNEVCRECHAKRLVNDMLGVVNRPYIGGA